MRHTMTPWACLLLCSVANGTMARQSELPRVLFLTHSAGFMHEVVRRPAPDQLSLAEAALVSFARGRFAVDATQDCAAISAANLARYAAVAFYTTGELPIDANGRAALIDWVAQGGAFVGVHCATDTLYQYAPYMQMIGAAFDGHPWHEEVMLKVEQPQHPALAHLGTSWTITDEIYQFRNFERYPNAVLLSLEPGSADLALGKRQDGDYANAWTRPWGRGRVFYTALGHRPELWSDPLFQQHLLGGIEWAMHGPDLPVPAPYGARRLFQGDNLRNFLQRDGKDAAWRVVDGAFEVTPGSGDLLTRESFGDGLLHVEFQIPQEPAQLHGQERGNSGVYLGARYEVQVLDSFGTPASTGDCGALYNLAPSNPKAQRAPLEWQTYDIRFHAPHFGAAGEKVANARLSLWHNGMLVHDEVELPAPTGGGLEGDERSVAPLLLQDHGRPVRYRNLWFQSF